MDVVTGNAAEDGDPFRGWFVGHFIPAELGPRSTDNIEVKWGIHHDGEQRPAWAASAEATTLSLLVRGAIRLFFGDGSQALLDRPGDYALWQPRTAHHWQIEADNTIVLTVRWPSIAGDAADLDEAALEGA